MSRRKTAKKRIVSPDPRYDSPLVSMIITRLLKKGKKTLAQQIFYETMKKIELALPEQEPLKVLHQAVRNVTPLVEVKSRRVGGSTYQVPLEVKKERGITLALRWLLQSARNRPGRGIVSKLANEFIDAFNKTGNTIRKKDETQRMAEANKAFAHYRY